jgi:hypothetical protein
MSFAHVNNKVKSEKASWDAAIADAEERIKRFKFCIKTWKAAKKSGLPWPGTDMLVQSAEQSSQSATHN